MLPYTVIVQGTRGLVGTVLSEEVYMNRQRRGDIAFVSLSISSRTSTEPTASESTSSNRVNDVQQSLTHS